MNSKFINDLVSKITSLKTFNKKTVFSIATTANQEDESYFTPVRVSNDFAMMGCVIFDQKVLLPLLEKIDGLVDIILVDSEKKIPLRIFNHSK